MTEDTEIIQRRAKEHWANIAIQVGFTSELIINALHQIRLVPKGLSILAKHLVKLRIVKIVEGNTRRDMLFIGIEEIQTLVVDAVNTLELGTHVDRPAQRRQAKIQFLLDLV